MADPELASKLAKRLETVNDEPEDVVRGQEAPPAPKIPEKIIPNPYVASDDSVSIDDLIAKTLERNARLEENNNVTSPNNVSTDAHVANAASSDYGTQIDALSGVPPKRTLAELLAKDQRAASPPLTIAEKSSAEASGSARQAPAPKTTIGELLMKEKQPQVPVAASRCPVVPVQHHQPKAGAKHRSPEEDGTELERKLAAQRAKKHYDAPAVEGHVVFSSPNEPPPPPQKPAAPLNEEQRAAENEKAKFFLEEQVLKREAEEGYDGIEIKSNDEKSEIDEGQATVNTVEQAHPQQAPIQGAETFPPPDLGPSSDFNSPPLEPGPKLCEDPLPTASPVSAVEPCGAPTNSSPFDELLVEASPKTPSSALPVDETSDVPKITSSPSSENSSDALMFPPPPSSPVTVTEDPPKGATPAERSEVDDQVRLEALSQNSAVEADENTSLDQAPQPNPPVTSRKEAIKVSHPPPSENSLKESDKPATSPSSSADTDAERNQVPLSSPLLSDSKKSPLDAADLRSLLNEELKKSKVTVEEIIVIKDMELRKEVDRPFSPTRELLEMIQHENGIRSPPPVPPPKPQTPSQSRPQSPVVKKLLKPGIAATADQKMFTERQNKPTSFVQKSLSQDSCDELSALLERRTKILQGETVPEMINKKLSLYAEFSEFSRKQIKFFTETFKKYDEDADGFIDFDELKRMMEKLGEAQTHIALKEIIRKVDEDQDGKISLREFFLIFRLSAQNQLGCSEVFQILADSVDVSKEGVLGAANFFQAKIEEQTKTSRFEQEMKEEQEERKRLEEEKRARREKFLQNKSIFQ